MSETGMFSTQLKEPENLQVGDWVAYSVVWLHATYQTLTGLASDRGKIVSISSGVIALVDWVKGGQSRVHLCNLASIGGFNFWNRGQCGTNDKGIFEKKSTLKTPTKQAKRWPIPPSGSFFS